MTLLPLQELMSLAFVQEKFCTSNPCFIFYANSIHVAWALHQILPKLLRSSMCIKLMVTHMPTILWVSPLLSMIFTLALIVPLVC
ncbi:hypothetical protein GW17_00028292 [Ensete ventricosum]|nr:hypothetical protein GW17_00028292 [Ensete ventricosum]